MDAGQNRSLVEHVLKSADANGQIDRLVGDFSQLLGIIHLERKIGSARRAPKTSARQFDHARRHIDPDATIYFRSNGEEVMAIAATEVRHNIAGPGPSEASHKRQSVLEQPLRVTVLLRRTHQGTSIEERPDIRGIARWCGRDTAKR